MALGPVIGIFNEDIEHLRTRKVLSEAVGGGSLDTPSRCRDETLERGRVQPAREFLFLGLDTRDDGYGEQVLVHLSIEVEDLPDFLVRLFFSEEGGVAFLP
jgi:hypothetical protein